MVFGFFMHLRAFEKILTVSSDPLTYFLLGLNTSVYEIKNIPSGIHLFARAIAIFE